MRIWMALAALAAISCLGLVSSSISLSNGVQLRIIGTPSPLKTELEPASGNSFYRIFRDENNLAVFAYELVVDRTPDGEQFRITAKPAEEDFAARFPYADGGKPTPTFSAAIESPLLADGGEFSLDVPTDPGINGGHVTDTVQVQMNRRGAPAVEVETQTSQMRFATLRVLINGKLASPSGAGTTVTGRYAMFYLPGRGAYIFSAQPVESRPFLHVGMVDHGTLEFTLDNISYTCKSDAPILVHSGSGEVWVYHDPNYKPAGNWTKSLPGSGSRDEFFTAASDSPNWWVPPQ